MQQILAQGLRFSRQQPGWQSWRFQRVDCEDHVFVFVIEDRRKDTLRQLGRFVLDLLASLIELSLNSIRRCVVLEYDGKEREARSRIGIHMVVICEFLHPLLQRIRYQRLHLPRSGTGPCRRDGKHLDRKAGIFGATQIEIGECAGDNERDKEEERDGAFLHRKRGKIDSLLCSLLLLKSGFLNFKFAHRIAAFWSATRTCWPSLSR